MIVVRIKVAATFLSFQAPHNSKLCFACQPSFYRLVDVTNLVSFATLLLLSLYCCYFARCITIATSSYMLSYVSLILHLYHTINLTLLGSIIHRKNIIIVNKYLEF